MGNVLLLALAATVNPTMFAALLIMVTLPSPKRLMLGYISGGFLVSVATGLVLVNNVDSIHTTEKSVSPALDLVFGLLALAVALALGTGRDARLAERRRKRRGERPREPWSQRVLGRGSARVAFAVGAVLNLPGLYYLLAIKDIADKSYSPPVPLLLILLFNVIMFLLLELPLVGYLVSPHQTEVQVHRFKDWLSRNGRRIAVIAAAGVGAYLVLRGVLSLLS